MLYTLDDFKEGNRYDQLLSVDISGSKYTLFGRQNVLQRWSSAPVGEFPYKKDVVLEYLLGVKKAILVPLRVLSLKSSTAGAFAVPIKVSSRKNMTADHVLF